MRRLLPFLLLAAACRTAEPPVSQDRVVIAPAKPKGDPKQAPEWFAREIGAASDDLRAGRLEEGLKRVLHARAQNPAGEDAAALDDLLRRFNQAVLDLPLLVASVEPERDPIAFGEPVRVRIRLSNPGSRTVRVRARTAKSSGSLFLLDVVRTEYDIVSHVVSTRLKAQYALRDDLELPPRGMTEIVLTVADAGNDRPLDGFRIYAVGGQLRAGAIELDGLRRYDPVRLREGRLRSFRPNYEHLADDPVRRVRQAIERKAPLHLLTAAALVPAQGRRDAVETLVGSLGGGGPMDFAAFAALAYLTNADLGNDADAWRGWWSRVREHYFDVPEGEGPGEGPRFAK